MRGRRGRRASMCCMRLESMLGHDDRAWTAGAATARGARVDGCSAAGAWTSAEGRETCLPGRDVTDIKGWVGAADALRGLTVVVRPASAPCARTGRIGRSQGQHSGPGRVGSLVGGSHAELIAPKSLRARWGLVVACVGTRVRGLHVRGD